MASTISTGNTNCCAPQCTDAVGLRVPGPKGDPGTNGTNGTDGKNAYTVLTAAFTMPAEGADASAEVLNSGWMTVGQNVFMGFAGYLQVISKADATHALLRNIENTALGTYADNAPAATVIPIGAAVSPGGLQGPGTSNTNFNLSGVVDPVGDPADINETWKYSNYANPAAITEWLWPAGQASGSLWLQIV